MNTTFLQSECSIHFPFINLQQSVRMLFTYCYPHTKNLQNIWRAFYKAHLGCSAKIISQNQITLVPGIRKTTSRKNQGVFALGGFFSVRRNRRKFRKKISPKQQNSQKNGAFFWTKVFFTEHPWGELAPRPFFAFGESCNQNRNLEKAKRLF